MKKVNVYSILGLVVLIITSLMWYLGSVIETFKFDLFWFIFMTFFAWAALIVHYGIKIKSSFRIGFGGVLIAISTLALLHALTLLNGFGSILAVVFAILSLTSLCIMLVTRGNKWDNGNNQ